MRTGKTMGGKRMKPGCFNASDLNLKRQGLAQFWAMLLGKLDNHTGLVAGDITEEVSKFMVSFFNEISSESYTFFVEQETPNESQRNPLKGSYAYGRTGRTPQDPLCGFFHLKYNKAGTPAPRIVKPGKYTPYRVSPNGDVDSPYEEKGSKLQRQPNGKYRHIASYSLEELIALGWDGAMYTSARGQHAANGHYVPFVVGYDSDADDEYEPIDVQAGKRAGIIGLPSEENGFYMALPDFDNPGQWQLGQIRNAR